MFILLAVTFTLGVFLGVLIVCLLIIAKENQEGQDVAEVLSGNDRGSLYLLSHPARGPERI
jgi:hypothetical protein